ncbi:hypothetical protein EDC14_103622 [Hydrogenispora ethanolica]|jgi:hypothetical protein|uniref:Uncharacterized protein n=1 Tax=Hydrogenispora ethanolica TaxID=1082276 RepID=A0A4R1R499_HYDET|nr:hypothetical protein [Hydrogenispora ethanolica]TCL60269.1 hypothetical protein EDC14_103622 [Hydrogenispora ethanolica]
MVGLSLLLGLIVYALIMIVLTAWLVKHHNRRMVQESEINEGDSLVSPGNYDQLTQPNRRTGHQKSDK